jgi:hypothetical protein
VFGRVPPQPIPDPGTSSPDLLHTHAPDPFAPLRSCGALRSALTIIGPPIFVPPIVPLQWWNCASDPYILTRGRLQLSGGPDRLGEDILRRKSDGPRGRRAGQLDVDRASSGWSCSACRHAMTPRMHSLRRRRGSRVDCLRHGATRRRMRTVPVSAVTLEGVSGRLADRPLLILQLRVIQFPSVWRNP